MIGVIVNTLSVLLGSAFGLLLKKGIPQKFSGAVMTAIGLCTVCIGIDGMLQGENTLVLIFSVVFGVFIGTLLNIDGGISALSDFCLKKASTQQGNVTEGFITATLLFCVGAMAIVGSLNSGLTGDHKLIFTKSFLDLISATMLSATLGIGVLFSAVFVFLYQGALVLLANSLQTVLTTAVINEITCVGSLIVFALGLNLIGLTKIKVANFLPAILLTPFAYYGLQWLMNLLNF
ncbi:MAG: DUF554 domain-containing protein [Clostridia bacterium]|nr:DUF554 domain-containing protein [Clostridia bacterium]